MPDYTYDGSTIVDMATGRGVPTGTLIELRATPDGAPVTVYDLLTGLPVVLAASSASSYPAFGADIAEGWLVAGDGPPNKVVSNEQENALPIAEAAQAAAAAAATAAGDALTQATTAATAAEASRVAAEAAAAAAEGGGGGGGVASVAGRTGAVVLTKADVGLSLVDNTADEDKPVSVAQQAALDQKMSLTGAQTKSGVVTFTSSPTVPDATTSAQVPNKGQVDAAVATVNAAIATVARVRLTANQTVNNNAATPATTALTFAGGVDQEWDFEALLYYTSSTGADIKVRIAVPAGATLYGIMQGPATGTTGYSTGHLTAPADAWTAPTLQGMGGNGATVQAARIAGTVVFGSTAGSVVLEFAQNTAEVSDTVLRAGSIISAVRVV